MPDPDTQSSFRSGWWFAGVCALVFSALILHHFLASAFPGDINHHPLLRAALTSLPLLLAVALMQTIIRARSAHPFVFAAVLAFFFVGTIASVELLLLVAIALIFAPASPV